jgi:hypothetical protein
MYYTPRKRRTLLRVPTLFRAPLARSLNSLGLLLDLILCDFREIISRQQPTTSSISFAPTDSFFPFPHSNSDARCVESTFGFSRARSCRLQYYSRELFFLQQSLSNRHSRGCTEAKNYDQSESMKLLFAAKCRLNWRAIRFFSTRKFKTEMLGLIDNFTTPYLQLVFFHSFYPLWRVVLSSFIVI